MKLFFSVTARKIIIKFDYGRLQALHGQCWVRVAWGVQYIVCWGDWLVCLIMKLYVGLTARKIIKFDYARLQGQCWVRVAWGVQYIVCWGDGLVSLIMKLYVSVTARKTIIKFDYARLLGQGGLGVSILWVWSWSCLSVWQHIKLLSNLIMLDSRPCRISAGSGWSGGQYIVCWGDGLVSLIMKLYVSVTAHKIIIKFDYARLQASHGQFWVRVVWGSAYFVWGRWTSEFDHEVVCQCDST